ncbi:MAG: PAS domain-containing protein, partial [Bradyrhizobium sp.]
MNTTEFQLQAISDPRLAVHATTALPVWLWSIDGTRMLWANPVGAGFFGAANAADLAAMTFGPADPQRRQIVQLAGKLLPNGATRLERLRGFGARLGLLVTCACARLEFADGSHGVLIAPTETSRRAMPLVERLRHLVEGIDRPIAAFARDGGLIFASDAARDLLGIRNPADDGFDEACKTALTAGRAEAPIGTAHMVLRRVGSGTDVGLVALLTPSTAQAAPSAGPTTPPAGIEPSPDVEAVADEPASVSDTPAANEVDAAAIATVRVATPPWLGHAAPEPRRQPLRFVWQMDADARFSTDSDEFIALIGPHVANNLGRRWSEIADDLGVDPEGRLMAAFATHDTWSGIILNWPVDGGGGLPIELAGLPVFDRARSFAGFRGFAMCRDLDALARLAAYRRFESENEPPTPRALSADTVPSQSRHRVAPVPPAEPDVMGLAPTEPAAAMADETTPPSALDGAIEPPPNVVPFRPPGEARSPMLTPVESSAFNELARQLSARLDRGNAPALTRLDGATIAATGEPCATETPQSSREPGASDQPSDVQARPEWLTQPEPPAEGNSKRDRTLLDLLPTGILIYRLDRLLYANPAFLERMGYASLHALEQDGGLDALYVEPGVSAASSTSQAGTPVTIAASQAAAGHAAATEARLFTIAWDDEAAHALMFAPAPSAAGDAPAASTFPATPVSAPPASAGHVDAEDFAAILDTAAEGLLMFDASGNIHACNRSTEALFGQDGNELSRRNLVELFAPESQRVVLDYLESVKGAGAASLLEPGRDVLACVGSKGGIMPLSMTMGRTRPEGPNFFAVFRDRSQGRTPDGEPREARRLADRAASAKADMLARISHEVRAPLNAIIGFAEVMIGERFGALGNERYAEYLKDIRASGEGVIAIIDDLTELSRIETGKL